MGRREEKREEERNTKRPLPSYSASIPFRFEAPLFRRKRNFAAAIEGGGRARAEENWRRREGGRGRASRQFGSLFVLPTAPELIGRTRKEGREQQRCNISCGRIKIGIFFVRNHSLPVSPSLL